VFLVKEKEYATTTTRDFNESTIIVKISEVVRIRLTDTEQHEQINL
jgi:hypothetical protein